MGDQPNARPLPTQYNTTQKNVNTYISMPKAGFEPTISVFERTKRVRALDRAATGTGNTLCIRAVISCVFPIVFGFRTLKINIGAILCYGTVYIYRKSECKQTK
jgi:hypothetical protein